MITWNTHCPTCGEMLGTGGCLKCGAHTWYALGPNPGPVFGPVFHGYPPAVCTGTGTVAVDLFPMATHVEGEGECGICGQRVRISEGRYLVTHPYTPKARGEARDVR